VILSRPARLALLVATLLGLVALFTPLFVVLVNSFNPSKIFGWPPSGFTLEWWRRTIQNAGFHDALWTSIKAGLGASLIAVVLGTMAAFAVQRYKFFGRDTISFLVILPIALPGIVTGIALNSAINTAFQPLGLSFGLFTVIIGHATFCIVVIYNNVLARLRRMGAGMEEASADLGADTWQTFRYVTFPQMRSALFAGGLLAFALSFDEIVVTTFTISPGLQTLPIWIFNNLFRPNQAPVVNVVAAMLVLLSIVPIYDAQRLSSDTGGGRL
jgi:putative spermidine/putrescine transport system permease protein